MIPKWLIELTGDPKRIWNLGVRLTKSETKIQRFSADQFQFPACDSCNKRYSALEGRSAEMMSHLLKRAPLKGFEWHELLDWFDKVRTGLWLGMMMLGGEVPQPTPNFYIDQRIGLKDRCILVYRIGPEHRGLIMHGASDPCFFFRPSCFGITINDLIFVNVSSEFLLSARMGFPFPRTMEDTDDLTIVSDWDVFYRTKVPILRWPHYQPVLEVYQAVLADGILSESEKLAHSEYRALCNHDFIASRLMFVDQPRSLIHTIQRDLCVAIGNEEEIVEKDLPEKSYRHGVDYVKQVLEFREILMIDYAKTGRGAKSAELIHELRKFNRWAMAGMNNEERN